VPTIKRFEPSCSPLGGPRDTRQRIVEAIKMPEVELIAENGGGPGVRLNKAKPRL
jgi:hypothetical protein